MKNHEANKITTRLMIVLHSVSLLIVVFAFGAFVSISSEEVVFQESEGSVIGVSGFTNLDIWRMETKDLKLEASFVIASGNLNNINSLKLTTPVNSLKSTYSHMVLWFITYLQLKVSMKLLL